MHVLSSDLRRAEDDECRIQQLEDDDPTYSSTNETLSKSQSMLSSVKVQ